MGRTAGRGSGNTLGTSETALSPRPRCAAARRRLDRPAVIGFFDRLFRQSQPELSEAGAGDAAAIASLHSASFNRGWSEMELESLLVDQNVIAHRALTGRKLTGFILSRKAADEAEILSVAVAASRRGRGVAQDL